ncbi:MAG: electron transfer flavoprotein subunit beta, partial [Thermoplasmata archaeon]
MHIVVIQRMVADVVEELELDPDGLSLLEGSVRYITNELDEHALEQALLLKERHRAKVTAIVVGIEEADQALAAALAKGADEGLKLVTDFGRWRDNHRLASLLSSVLKELDLDLILTGVQAIDDLDGSLGGILAAQLDLPYCGSIASLRVDSEAQKAVVEKEYPGGLLGVMEVSLPAILGIGSAERPPRYVPVSKIRYAMRSMSPREVSEAPEAEIGVSIVGMAKPEASKAEMIAGSPEEIAERVVSILKESG